MFNLFRRLICKHEWMILNKVNIMYGDHLLGVDYAYGCGKCGKVERLAECDFPKWKFKELHKGCIVNNKIKWSE